MVRATISEDHEMIMISLPIGLLLHFMYVQSMHDYLKRDITLKPAPFAFWCSYVGFRV